MSLQAYKTASTRAEAPRETEYRLFGQVTRALMHASTLDKTQFAERMDALDWNRRLWSTLATACSDPNNALPQEVRAHIISLSIFVGKHTSLVARGEDDFATLIDINRMIMQGLSGQAS
ncbi:MULTISPECIES: flagellar biosynthesis regulator FlaF [unclassified Brevundimonas]|uniref:flagellar biosynthesis regulator FlaF n=1 Tax=unclassified Brevundimonas TaxID=2622653 RepID=UPI0025BDAD03|nr:MULTISPECIES: flagellar biosynthesis regulator FlaF [unclassified Brevundimonas]